MLFNLLQAVTDTTALMQNPAVQQEMKLSLIVPCYNEAENVAAFQAAVLNAFDGCGYDYEIIFIDDGSRDATMFQLRKLFAEQKCPVKVVSFSRNFGKEAAMYALDAFYAGKWDTDLANKFISLGAKDGAVGLPTATWSMKNYKVSDYEELLGKIKAGTVSIDNDADWTSIASKAAALSNITFLYE